MGDASALPKKRADSLRETRRSLEKEGYGKIRGFSQAYDTLVARSETRLETDKEALAVYGTLRNGNKNLGIVKNAILVYPSTTSYPAVIHSDSDEDFVVVEVHYVDNADLFDYDWYEGVDSGLFSRVKTEVYMDDGKVIDAWIYVAGDALLQYTGVFQKIDSGDWFDRF